MDFEYWFICSLLFFILAICAVMGTAAAMRSAQISRCEEEMERHEE